MMKKLRVVLSSSLKDYIRNFESMDEAADRLNVSIPTLYALLKDSQSPSNEFIAKVKENVGWDFEKAFEIKEEEEDSHGRESHQAR